MNRQEIFFLYNEEYRDNLNLLIHRVSKIVDFHLMPYMPSVL